MRRALLFSAIFHLSIALAAIVGLPIFERETPAINRPIPVELVSVGDITNLPQQQPKTAQPGPPPSAKPKPSPAPPAPPTPAAAAPPRPDAVPPPPTKKKKTPPKPKQAAEKPEPVRKARLDGPAPRTKPARQKPLDTMRIAALLDKSRPKPDRTASETPKPDVKQPTREKESLASTISRSLSTRLTISEVDAIRAQIQECWIVPAGARYAEDLSVRLRIFLRRDGGLARTPEVVDSDRMTRDTHFRTAAEHAVRAVQKCVPLRNLPADKYDRWRDIELTFDPREMLGG